MEAKKRGNLVLTRKVREVVRFHMNGEVIEVQVVKADRGKARLAIRAPEWCNIVRAEIDEEVAA